MCVCMYACMWENYNSYHEKFDHLENIQSWRKVLFPLLARKWISLPSAYTWFYEIFIQFFDILLFLWILTVLADNWYADKVHIILGYSLVGRWGSILEHVRIGSLSWINDLLNIWPLSLDKLPILVVVHEGSTEDQHMNGESLCIADITS